MQKSQNPFKNAASQCSFKGFSQANPTRLRWRCLLVHHTSDQPCGYSRKRNVASDLAADLAGMLAAFIVAPAALIRWESPSSRLARRLPIAWLIAYCTGVSAYVACRHELCPAGALPAVCRHIAGSVGPPFERAASCNRPSGCGCMRQDTGVSQAGVGCGGTGDR